MRIVLILAVVGVILSAPAVAVSNAPEGFRITRIEPAHALKQEGITLIWPQNDVCLEEISAQYGGDIPKGVPGYTDSGQPVRYRVDGGRERSVKPRANGDFWIPDAGLSPGKHTIRFRTRSARFPEKVISHTFFMNALKIAAPRSKALYSPGKSGRLKISFTSLTKDIISAEVVDPYCPAPSRGSNDAPPVLPLLNGDTAPTVVRTLAKALPVNRGANAVFWDGKDNGGRPVSPGIYEIRVSSTNKLAQDLEDRVRITLTGSSKGPSITANSTLLFPLSTDVVWRTDVPTTGYVLCLDEVEQGMIFASSERPGVSHTVRLPHTERLGNCTYYIVATDPRTKASTISDVRKLGGRGKLYVSEVSDLPVSATAVDIFWATRSASTSNQEPEDVAATSIVEYAEVAPKADALQWRRVEDGNLVAEHAISLTELQPDTSYIYRVLSSPDSKGSEFAASEYGCFTTGRPNAGSKQ